MEIKNELELKLILGSNFKGWNVSENFLFVKNLTNEPWEFGYAVGASRPLALKASAKRCTFCPQNFVAGAEMYGGLGDRYSFGLHETSQYLAPALRLDIPSGLDTTSISPTFGLNDNSHQFMLRWGIAREINRVWRYRQKSVRSPLVKPTFDPSRSLRNDFASFIVFRAEPPRGSVQKRPTGVISKPANGSGAELLVRSCTRS